MAARRERGELRVPVLPDALRPTEPHEPPPRLPVLSAPRTRRRRLRVGLGPRLGIALAVIAAVAAALVLAQPGGHTASPPATTAATARTPPAPAEPFQVVPVSEPRAVLTAVEHGSSVLLGSDAAWLVGGSRGAAVSAEVSRVALPKGSVENVGSFEEPLTDAGFASRDGSLVLVGGDTGSKLATGVLLFSPPGGVALLARFRAGVRGAAVALVGGELYVAGGRTAAGPSQSLWVVDLAGDKVRALRQLPHPVAGGALVPVGRKLWLLEPGGVWRIDPRTGQAHAAGALPAALVGARSLGTGSIVVAGGRAYRLRP